MKILLPLIGGLCGLILLGTILLAPLKYRRWRELRRKSDADLENEVFYFPDNYFSFIGKEHDEVNAFKQMIERKDLNSIIANWKRLRKKFRKLEIEAGHRGRPLLLDHYCWYEMAFRELRRRNT